MNASHLLLPPMDTGLVTFFTIYRSLLCLTHFVINKNNERRRKKMEKKERKKSEILVKSWQL